MATDRNLIDGILNTGPHPQASPPPLPPELAGEESLPPRTEGPPDWIPEEPPEPFDPETSEEIIFPEEAIDSAGSQKAPSNGIDTWAYYLPFHFHGERRWGIYVKESGIRELARRLTNRLPLGVTSSIPIYDIAFDLLYEHEFFHHKVEVACSRLQYPGLLAGCQPMYPSYFSDTYASNHEEMLANAAAITSLKRPSPSREPRTRTRTQRIWDHMPSHLEGALKQAAIDEFLTHPRPYCDFHRYLRAMPRGRKIILSRMLDAAAVQHPVGLLQPHDPLRPMLRESGYFHDIERRSTGCPVRIVFDLGQMRWVRRFPAEYGLQVFVYTNDHRPKHIHVLETQEDKRREKHRYLWPEVLEDPNTALYKVTSEAKESEDYTEKVKDTHVSSLKKLKKYLDKHHKVIGRKVHKVYGAD